MRKKLLVLGAVFGAFVVSGPLQYVGVLPQTVVGDASKAMIKAALDMSSEPAFGSCGGVSHGGGKWNFGNNGFGNGGGDGVPGHSGFEDRDR